MDWPNQTSAVLRASCSPVRPTEEAIGTQEAAVLTMPTVRFTKGSILLPLLQVIRLLGSLFANQSPLNRQTASCLDC